MTLLVVRKCLPAWLDEYMKKISSLFCFGNISGTLKFFCLLATQKQVHSLNLPLFSNSKLLEGWGDFKEDWDRSTAQSSWFYYALHVYRPKRIYRHAFLVEWLCTLIWEGATYSLEAIIISNIIWICITNSIIF